MDSRDGRTSPTAVAVAFLVGSVAWILGTDALLAVFVADETRTSTLQTLKGLFFVTGTAGLLFFLLRRRERAVVETVGDLEDARQRFASVVAASPLPIVALDTDGTVEVWNEAAEDTFGWDSEAVVGEPLPFVPDEAESEFRANLERVLDGGVIEDRHIQRQTADGERLSLSLSAAPVRDEDGEVTGVMALLWDVTEREARERALAEYRDLVDNLPVGVFRTATRGRDEFVEVNPAMVSMFDADGTADLLGRALSELTVDEPVGDWFAGGNGDTVAEEARFRSLGGEVFWARATAIRREDDDGEVYVEGIMEDVSERRERERQLAVLDRVLRHNLRNKMSVIQGRASDIATWTDGPAADAAREIHDQGQALLDVADDQREIVDLVAVGPDPQSRDVVATVERQVAAVRDRHAGVDVRIAVPETAHALAIEELDAAVRELLDNAVRHTADPEPSVEVRVETGTDTVTLSVADDGPGIPDPEVDVLTHESEIGPLYHGSGMGLWMVHWIVRLSGGTLRFSDNEPRGSVVTVVLDRP